MGNNFVLPKFRIKRPEPTVWPEGINPILVIAFVQYGWLDPFTIDLRSVIGDYNRLKLIEKASVEYSLQRGGLR